MKERLRHFWHELYYKLTFQAGSNFALTCKQAVEHINVVDPSTQTWQMKFRLRLHLSLCQACVNYVKASRALGKAAREFMKSSDVSIDIEKLNQELLKKYTGLKRGEEND
jgi:hypothetical protein